MSIEILKKVVKEIEQLESTNAHLKRENQNLRVSNAAKEKAITDLIAERDYYQYRFYTDGDRGK